MIQATFLEVVSRDASVSDEQAESGMILIDLRSFVSRLHPVESPEPWIGIAKPRRFT